MNLVTLLLETKVPLTAEQIANELAEYYPANPEALRGAFERDKRVLASVGIPLAREVLGGDDAGKSAYRIDREAYELRNLELDDDERRALQLALSIVRLDDGVFGLLKLGGDAPATVPVQAAVPELDDLPTLYEAVAQRRDVRFGYRGARRHLYPYGILLRRSRWYVVGFDVDAGAQRTYRVDRIEGGAAVGEPDAYEIPEGFRASEAFPQDPREIGSGTPQVATVRLDAHRARLLAGARPDGDGVVVDVPATNRDAFRSWLFGWGEGAEVLGPPELRAEVLEWLRALAVPR